MANKNAQALIIATHLFNEGKKLIEYRKLNNLGIDDDMLSNDTNGISKYIMDTPTELNAEIENQFESLDTTTIEEVIKILDEKQSMAKELKNL